MADLFDSAWDDFDSAWDAAPGYESPNIPTPADPEGGYGGRFYDQFSDPDKSLTTGVMGILPNTWNTLKGAYNAVKEVPQDVSNIYNHYDLIDNKMIRKVIGEEGKLAARYNPAFFLTGPAYDKLLNVADPENFDATTPEQDADKVMSELLMGTTGVLGGKAAGAVADTGLTRAVEAGRSLRGKLGNSFMPEEVIPEQVLPGEVTPGIPYGEVPPIPDQVIPGSPEVRTGEFMDWKPEPSFEGTVTPAQRSKSLRTSRQIDPETGAVTSALDRTIANNQEVLSLPPEESLAAIVGQKEAALAEATDLVREAEANHQPQPSTAAMETGDPEFTIPTPTVEAQIQGIRNASDRAMAADYWTQRKAEFEQNWDGTLEDLHKEKSQFNTKNPRVFEKGLGDTPPSIVKTVEKAFSGDMNTYLRNNVEGYQAANAKASEMLRLERIADNRLSKARGVELKNTTGPVKTKVLSRAVPDKVIPGESWEPTRMNQLPPGKPGSPAYQKVDIAPDRVIDEQTIPAKSIPGPWQGKVNSLTKFLAPLAGAVGGGALGEGVAGTLGGVALGGAIGQSGGVAQALGGTAGGIGNIASELRSALRSPAIQGLGPSVGPMVQSDNYLPRTTSKFDSGALAEFLLRTSGTPEAEIARGLVSKMQKAFHARDMDTVEKIHSDMARLFPQMFEPGVGVNGKLFYPDDQAKFMDNLKQLNRMGVVDSIHLSKQKNAFNNKQDGRMLPMPNGGATQGPYQPDNSFVDGSRVYPY